MLEKGSTATSFDYRPYGTELSLCQRYYQQIGKDSSNAFIIGGYGLTANAGYACYTNPVTMRATPTLGVIGGTWTSVNSCAQPTIASYGADSVTIFAVTNSGITNANQSAVLTKSDGTTYIEIGAEL
jgi:hypothetical protein